MEEESSGSTGGIATLASVAFVVLSCTTMAVLAVMNHPHKAVLVLVGALIWYFSPYTATLGLG